MTNTKYDFQTFITHALKHYSTYSQQHHQPHLQADTKQCVAMWHSSRGKLKPAFKHPSLPNARGEADQPSCIVLVPIYLLLDSHSLMRDSHWERESGKLTSSHPETSSSSRLTSSPNLAGRVCSRFSPLQITCKHKHNEHIRNVYDWCMSMFKLGFYFVVKFFCPKDIVQQ